MKFTTILATVAIIASGTTLGIINGQQRLISQHQTIVELLAAENKDHRRNIQILANGIIRTAETLQHHVDHMNLTNLAIQLNHELQLADTPVM